jgi:hydrogenase-4 component F
MPHVPTEALLAAPVLVPALSAALASLVGWRRLTAWSTVTGALVVLTCGVVLASRVDGPPLVLRDLLRADALTAVMLLVIGSVATLATWASVDYLDDELSHHRTTPGSARLYAVLINAFIASMALAVLAANLGVVWVAVEATTVATAFLVGHRRTRASLEATWKYVVICSMGIALAFLGTVLLYFASLHAGPPEGALTVDVITARAGSLDPAVTRIAAGLLLLGYGTKVGLAPFHTWLADAHSQAPAPVSALMSGVLLSVAASVILRIRPVIDMALGARFLRVGLITLGLLTLLIAAGLLVAQRDYKRMLAYSSLEHMGLVAIAAGVGTELAVAALLLHVLAHGLAKAVLFITSGHLQHAYGSTLVEDVSGLLTRSRLLGISFAGGLVALLGFPPFALFASEVGIARSAAGAGLAWPLGLALLLVVVAFASIARHGGAMLLGPAPPDAPGLAVSRVAAVPIVLGLSACLTLGVAAGPLVDLLRDAAAVVTGAP